VLKAFAIIVGLEVNLLLMFIVCVLLIVILLLVRVLTIFQVAYIYSYILWIEKLVQVSTQDGVSHKTTKYMEILQYKSTVIHINILSYSKPITHS